MTQQQKQVMIQLRDEYLYRQRLAQEADDRLKLAMFQLGLKSLDLDILEPIQEKKDVPQQ